MLFWLCVVSCRMFIVVVCLLCVVVCLSCNVCDSLFVVWGWLVVVCC